MKKIILALLMVGSVFSAYSFVPSYYIIKEVSSEQVLTDVPEAVLNNFAYMFPDARSVRWRVLTGAYDNAKQYLALFREDNVKRTARFAPDGTYLGGS
jgi:hypothetical protein